MTYAELEFIKAELAKVSIPVIMPNNTVMGITASITQWGAAVPARLFSTSLAMAYNTAGTVDPAVTADYAAEVCVLFHGCRAG